MKCLIIPCLLLLLSACGEKDAALADCMSKYQKPQQRPADAGYDVTQCMQDKGYLLSIPHNECSDDAPYSGTDYSVPGCYEKLNWWDNII